MNRQSTIRPIIPAFKNADHGEETLPAIDDDAQG